MNSKKWKIAGFFIMLIILSRPSWSEWVLIDTALNRVNTQNANAPSICNWNNTPMVAWSEIEWLGAAFRNAVYVKQLNGSNWEQTNGYLNLSNTQNAYYPKITISNSQPRVVWKETEYPGASGIQRVYVKNWDGSQWQKTGTYLNTGYFIDAYPSDTLSLAPGTTGPYVAWCELSGANFTLHVKHWDGGAWVQDGGALNVGNTQNAESASIAVNGGIPWVAWQEMEYLLYAGGIWRKALYVKYFSGSWTMAGNGMLNYDGTRSAYQPRITFCNDVPYVVWYESSGSVDRVWVKHYVSGSNTWVQDGVVPVNMCNTQMASAPAITVLNNIPHVIWREEDFGVSKYHIYVKRLNGSNWEPVGSWLNQNYAEEAFNPDIVAGDQTLYAVWPESLNNTQQVYVKAFYYGSPTITPTVTHTATPSMTFSPTFTATVTATPTVTPTSTLTPSNTMTHTPTSTHTFTITPTLTESLTITETATETPSSTISPTPTRTPTSTETATTTPSSTISPTPTQTLTITKTITKTISATPSPTGSSTATPTITRTITLSPTKTISLYQMDHDKVIVYPSPARGKAAHFYYYVSRACHIKIEIFNLAGEKGRVLENDHAEEGYQKTLWNIENTALGIYYYRLTREDSEGKKVSGYNKLVVVK